MHSAVRLVGVERAQLKRGRIVANLQNATEVAEWCNEVDIDHLSVRLDRTKWVHMALPIVVEYSTRSNRTSVRTSDGGVKRTKRTPKGMGTIDMFDNAGKECQYVIMHAPAPLSLNQ